MKKALLYLAVVVLVLPACRKSEPPWAGLELSVNPAELTVASAGGATSFQITSNAEWKVTSSASWLTFEPAGGKGNATVTITVSSNAAYKDRTDAVSINSIAKRVFVNVKQEAAEKPVVPVETKITEIKTSDDFAKFASNINRYQPSETVKLEADVTITAPVDSLICNFDGQNHTITLNYEAKEAITDEDTYLADVGVFRKVAGTVRNLNTAGSIKAVQEGSGTYHVGGIAGYAAKSASFENCTNGIAITVTNNAITHHVGGVVGFVNPGVNLVGCRNTAKIEAVYKGASKASQVGGIIGHLENSIQISKDPLVYEKGVNIVENCVNDGDISYTGAGTCRMGGICGHVNNLNDVTFRNCTNNGAVSNDATGYSASSWAYVGGNVGYYGTPTEGGHVLYEGCVNNGPVSCDAAGTKLRARVAGINCHAGNSGQKALDNGDGINTWELKNCTNNGDISFKNGIDVTRAQVGGIQAYGEPSGTVIIDGCTSNGKLLMVNAQAQGKWNAVGALLGGNAATNSRFTNNIVTDKVVMTASLESAHVGLIVGTNNPYKTAVTGKVGAATIVKGETTTVVSSGNFSTLLFALPLGEGGTTDGVAFDN